MRMYSIVPIKKKKKDKKKEMQKSILEKYLNPYIDRVISLNNREFIYIHILITSLNVHFF